MKTYQIELNEEQMNIIAEAVEQYSRMLAGQIEYSFLSAIQYNVPMDDDFLWKREIVDHLLKGVKKVVFPHLGVHASKHNEQSDKAYDIYKSILVNRQKELKEEQGDAYVGNVHTPPQYAMSNLPLPKIKKI